MANGQRILLIEDNASYRKMLELRLKTSGYAVKSAKDGLEGLNTVRKFDPDLIITDIMLPGLNGHKICRMIKFDKQFHHIPVIILTSRDLDEDEEQAKKCGADAFIIKTTRTAIILEVVQKLLERYAGLNLQTGETNHENTPD